MATNSRPTTSHIGPGPAEVKDDYSKAPNRYLGPNHDIRARKPLSEAVLDEFRAEAKRLGRMLKDEERAAIIKRFSAGTEEDLLPPTV